MKEHLNILIIEDSELDAELIIHNLKKAEYSISFKRIESASELTHALKENEWDLIIADYSLPQFDAPTALKILHDSGLDIPFIVVSGRIGEETSVAMMKLGAHDYLMKDNLTRLVPVINRELSEARVRKERKIAEEKIKQYVNQLEQINADKDKFFSILAHDLKNPFFGVINLLKIIQDNLEKNDLKEIKNYIRIVYDTSKYVYKLLDNLLEWSRIQTGRIEFNREIINIKEIIKDNIALLESQANNKFIKIHFDLKKDYVVPGDENMLNVILGNLIGNAIKFTPKNRDIFITVHDKVKYFEICIKDAGFGIEQENIQELFKIDSKFRRAGTNNEKGTGLGLVLCKEFVEKHGGKIWVESELEKGSEFKFTLPKTF